MGTEENLKKEDIKNYLKDNLKDVLKENLKINIEENFIYKSEYDLKVFYCDELILKETFTIRTP